MDDNRKACQVYLLHCETDGLAWGRGYSSDPKCKAHGSIHKVTLYLSTLVPNSAAFANHLQDRQTRLEDEVRLRTNKELESSLWLLCQLSSM